MRMIVHQFIVCGFEKLGLNIVASQRDSEFVAIFCGGDAEISALLVFDGVYTFGSEISVLQDVTGRPCTVALANEILLEMKDTV